MPLPLREVQQTKGFCMAQFHFHRKAAAVLRYGLSVLVLGLLLSVQPGGTAHADTQSYVGMQLRALPDQNDDQTFGASLALTNNTGTDIPASTVLTFNFKGLKFTPKDAFDGSLSGGATWQKLTTSKGIATLDSVLAVGESLNLSLILPLTSPPNTKTLMVKATLALILGDKKRVFSSNALTNVEDDGGLQLLGTKPPKAAGPTAVGSISGNFFADDEPVTVSVSPPLDAAPSTIIANDTGSISLSLGGLVAQGYSVELTGLWSGVRGLVTLLLGLRRNNVRRVQPKPRRSYRGIFM